MGGQLSSESDVEEVPSGEIIETKNDTENCDGDAYDDYPPEAAPQPYLNTDFQMVRNDFELKERPDHPFFFESKGPMPHETQDFWHKIIEKRIENVFMDGKFFNKDGKRVCGQYMPEPGSNLKQICGIYTVEGIMQQSKVLDNLFAQQLLVYRTDRPNGRKHQVQHFQVIAKRFSKDDYVTSFAYQTSVITQKNTLLHYAMFNHETDALVLCKDILELKKKKNEVVVSGKLEDNPNDKNSAVIQTVLNHYEVKETTVPSMLEAMGPLPDRTQDFWQMIIEKGIPNILMIGKFDMGGYGGVVCGQYIPLGKDKKQKCGIYTVKRLELVDRTENMVAQKLVVYRPDEKNPERHHVLHVQIRKLKVIQGDSTKFLKAFSEQPSELTLRHYQMVDEADIFKQCDEFLMENKTSPPVLFDNVEGRDSEDPNEKSATIQKVSNDFKMDGDYMLDKFRFVSDGPFPDKTQDFWHKIIENRIPSVYMVTDFFDEHGQRQCGRYVPERNQDTQICGVYTVKRLEASQQIAKNLFVQKLVVYRTNRKSAYQHRVLHFQSSDMWEYTRKAVFYMIEKQANTCYLMHGNMHEKEAETVDPVQESSEEEEEERSDLVEEEE